MEVPEMHWNHGDFIFHEKFAFEAGPLGDIYAATYRDPAGEHFLSDRADAFPSRGSVTVEFTSGTTVEQWQMDLESSYGTQIHDMKQMVGLPS